MEGAYTLNAMLDHNLILETAAKMDADPAFIEKDWYSVQLLKLLNEFQNDRGIEIVFSGGTSLSKGFGLIKRFSEDLDFILCTSDEVSVEGKRSFRKSIISHVISDPRFTIEEDGLLRGYNHRFFKADVQCDMEFKQESLRPYLQFEMTFFNHRLPLSKKNVQSIISEFVGGEPETQIACVSPIETASDKVSALTWRVLVRDRSSEKDDPTMVRHLHDLSAVKEKIWENKEIFIKCARQSLEGDQERRRGGDAIADMSISQRLLKACEMLSSDEEYRKEYELFVEDMSYANEGEEISFDKALADLKEIIATLI